MRVNNVKILMEIPVPFNNTDDNGVMYSDMAFKDACGNAVGQPIEIINNDGSSTVVGVATEVCYIADEINGDYIRVNGNLFHGGTSEQVSINKGMVTDVRLTSFGVTV